MDLLDVTRDLDRLAEADAVIADSYLRCLLDKSALYATAGLIAVGGLAAFELSVFWLLDRSVGPVASAALIAAANGALAALVLLLALRVRPGPEFSIALDMRRSAIQALEKQLSPAERSVAPAQAFRPALDTLLSAVVVPLLMVLVRSVRDARAARATAPPGRSDAAAAADHP